MSADRLAKLQQEARKDLAKRPDGALADEIAKAIKRRPRDVREALRLDPLVVQTAAPTGKKWNARAWKLTDDGRHSAGERRRRSHETDPSLPDGTGRDRQGREL